MKDLIKQLNQLERDYKTLAKSLECASNMAHFNEETLNILLAEMERLDGHIRELNQRFLEMDNER